MSPCTISNIKHRYFNFDLDKKADKTKEKKLKSQWDKKLPR